MTEFECKSTCSLSRDGKCTYIKGVSWINILNCTNPDVWKDHKNKIKQEKINNEM